MEEREGFDASKTKSFDMTSLVRKAVRGWKRILLCIGIGCAFGLIVGISTPRKYTSKAVMAPEIATRSSMGGLSSLASLAGVNINSMALTDAMHPDMYPAIIHSSNFNLELFDLPVSIETRDSVVHTNLYDYMLNYYKTPWYAYVLGFPMFAAHGIKSIFSGKKEDSSGMTQYADSLRLTRQQERVMRRLSKCIKANVEKKTYLLYLRVTLQDPVIAAQVVNEIIDKLKCFVVDYRTEKARENRDYYQKIYEETRNDYLIAQRAYTSYLDSHQGMMSKSSQVYQQQLQNEAQLRFQMYSQTAQNLLNAEAKIQQEAPVLVVIQQGVAPHIGKPSKVKLLLIWSFLGGIIGLLWVCWKK